MEPGTALASLAQLFSSPWLLGLMALAVPIGLLVGALPGIGGKTAIALAIPFVFGMEPLPGAVFLVAMHAVVHTGDAIPAILFGIPGGGPAAATVLDGYPLARQGQAGRALGASLGASAVGGVIGAIALAAFLPVLRPLALAFGPAEIFLLALLGISFIAVLSGDSPVKGLAVGCLGLLLSFVGMDPQQGAPRFAFGQLFLWDGVDVATAMLGMFAVPEMIALGARGGAVSEVSRDAAHYSFRQIGQGMLDVWRHRWLTLRTSLIGVVIGLIPGLGGDVASWLCYGHAVQSSKQPERFGHGAIEGVIAPETANNSKEGGALVPTLFFAVPGSSGMVLLLGAFTVLGISPGPGLLLEGGTLVWTLVFALAFSNLLAVVVFLAVTPWISALSFVRGGLVVPVVFLLTLVGSVAVTGLWHSLLVLAVLGVLGWALSRCGWPRAPFAIGLVLGQIAEVALHQSLTIWGPAFLLRPMVLALLAFSVTGLTAAALRGRRPGLPMPDREDAVLSALLLAVFLAAAWLALDYPVASRRFPLLVALPGVALCAVQLRRDLRPAAAGVAPEAAAVRAPLAAELALVAWFVGFVAAAIALGVVLGGALAAFAFLRWRARESVRTAAAWSAGAAGAVHVVFERVLGSMFFEGLLFEWLRSAA